jgi:hypothetical protein
MINHETGEVGDDDDIEYELIGRWFNAGFPSHCAIDWEHVIRRNDKVSRVQRADNPMLPVSGVVCTSCMKMLPKAKTG